MKKYYWVFQNYFVAGKFSDTTLDLINTNGAIVVNTSILGNIILRPANVILTPGQKFEFTGNELEKYTGKIRVTFQWFPGVINPSYSIIKKMIV